MIKPQRTWSHHPEWCSFSKRKCVGLSPSSIYTPPLDTWIQERCVHFHDDITFVFRRDVTFCLWKRKKFSCAHSDVSFPLLYVYAIAFPLHMAIRKTKWFHSRNSRETKKNLRPSARWFASNSNRKALNERRERESLWMHVCTLSEWMRNWSTK